MWENRSKIYSNKEGRSEMKKIIGRTAALAMSVLMAVGAVNTMAADEKASKFFTDVNENSYGWAVSYIDYIAERGIANGVGDNKYAPGNTIERGDYTIFISKIFNLKNADEFIFSFKDVPADSYYCDAITNAKSQGIITESNMFYPEEYITRIDAMTMLYRALSKGNYVGKYGTTNISMYSDASDVKDIEQQVAIGTLTAMGIIQGSDGMLKPNDTMSRAEMAVVMAKTVQLIEAAKEEAAKPVIKTDEEILEDQKKEEEEKEQNKSDESKDYIGEEILEPVIVQHGGRVEITDSSAELNGQSAVAVSNGSEADISDTAISVSDAPAITLDDGELVLNNADIKSRDNAAIKSDNGGNISISGGKISSVGDADTISIRNSIIELNEAEITADKNKSVISAGEDTDIDVKDSTLTTDSAAGSGANAGVFSIISDPEKRDEITIDVENSTLDNSKGAIFYVRDSVATINLNGGNSIKCSKLINSSFDRKNDQKKGSTLILNLKNKQSVENADIDLDSKTAMEIHIDSECSLSGLVNSNASSSDVDLFLDFNGMLELSGDMYVDQFDNGMDFDFRNIIDNGWNIYYRIDNAENDYLRGNTYDLRDGGRLIPN